MIYDTGSKLSSNTPEFIHSTFNILAYYYAHYLTEFLKAEKNSRLFIVRYEDMAFKPQENFRKISDFLNLKITPQEIQSWSQKTLFKQLPMASNSHFKGGGQEKWKKVFAVSFFDILRRKNIVEDALKQGYPISRSEFQGKPFPASLKKDWIRKAIFLSEWLPFWAIDQEHEIFKALEV